MFHDEKTGENWNWKERHKNENEKVFQDYKEDKFAIEIAIIKDLRKKLFCRSLKNFCWSIPLLHFFEWSQLQNNIRAWTGLGPSLKADFVLAVHEPQARAWFSMMLLQTNTIFLEMLDVLMY